MESSSIQKAIIFAVGAHCGQRRKTDGTLYSFHPLATGRILAMAGCDDPIVVGGITHDVLEDTPVKAEGIEAEFGAEVAGWVQALSEDKSQSWFARKLHTIESIISWSLPVALIKVADSIDNLRSTEEQIRCRFGDDVWDSFEHGREWQFWYYEGKRRAFAALVALASKTRDIDLDQLNTLLVLNKELGSLIHSLWPPFWRHSPNHNWEFLDGRARKIVAEEGKKNSVPA